MSKPNSGVSKKAPPLWAHWFYEERPLAIDRNGPILACCGAIGLKRSLKSIEWSAQAVDHALDWAVARRDRRRGDEPPAPFASRSRALDRSLTIAFD